MARHARHGCEGIRTHPEAWPPALHQVKQVKGIRGRVKCTAVNRHAGTPHGPGYRASPDIRPVVARLRHIQTCGTPNFRHVPLPSSHHTPNKLNLLVYTLSFARCQTVAVSTAFPRFASISAPTLAPSRLVPLGPRPPSLGNSPFQSPPAAHFQHLQSPFQASLPCQPAFSHVHPSLTSPAGCDWTDILRLSRPQSCLHRLGAVVISSPPDKSRISASNSLLLSRPRTTRMACPTVAVSFIMLQLIPWHAYPRVNGNRRNFLLSIGNLTCRLIMICPAPSIVSTTT